jgi:ATP-binding cassette subfamily G (WHITE) protein 2 (SNQ2)
MEEYEEMRRELTKLSLSRSKSAAGRSESRASTLQRITSRGTTASRRRASFVGTGDAGNLDADGEAQIGHDGKEDFELGPFLKEGHFEKRNEGGESAKKIGVVFKDLTVKGTGSTATHVRTLPSAVLGTFGPDLWKLLTRFIPAVHLARRPPTRTLIHDFSGVVRDGEMMLVLGRPGAGCSTLLRVIANTRASYAEVTGEVQYGSIPAEEQRKHYRGEVSYNPEDDIHLPNLSVWQTLQFALLNKTRKHSKEDLPILVNALMKIFGISHTKDTRVGNAFVPGISGGERKRVSIAETLATKSTVISWDNSTRGLDASTALDFARSLRVMTDISNRTTLTTLYQTSQAIYDLMDKVLLIDSGRMVYQGPASEAKGYFEKLGYLCPDRQTTADFLTAVTDPLERQFRDGMEAQAPKGAEELERVFKNSPNYKAVLEDVKRYEDQLKRTENADAKEFVKSVQEDKSRTVSKRSPYTVSFFRQVLACTRREFWLIKGDPTTLYTKYFIIIANGLIVGSLFYGQGDSTSSIFSRGGTLFFSILFLGWLQLSELMKAVSGREVVARQREYAFYRPSAVNLARVITDFPMLLPQVAVFGIIMYFLSGLDANVSKFWIYFLFVYLTAIMATALYRMFAALAPTINDAVRFSGISLNILVIYTGYVITKPQLISQKIWFGWLYYVNPISYAFEAVISNEFTGREFECAPTQLVPQGPGVDPQYQGCAIAGSQLGRTSVSGATYLETQFNYTRSHLWRNLGVLIAFAVLYILVTMAASEIFSFVGGGGGALIFKKSKKTKTLSLRPTPADEEMAGDAGDSSASSEKIRSNDEYGRHNMQKISGSESVFTWTDIEYSVPTPAGPKKLLNHVNGYVKPGVLVALMGVSGAGKTTLLNSLSQRHRMGVVSGEMMVDGRPLGPEFQRGTGYCEQQDLHDTTATIREALEFSAVLRQERTVLKSEKLAYVETVLDLLELREIQDAVISSLGVEQRKRLTIGVELAAKPNLLLFLDEPTSGLDSQSAFNIVHFLRKLSDAGQAIICTIHQPSAVLIQQFDMILALNPGGNLFYFGDVGESGQTVLQYFKDRGIDCPPNKNPAEFMLELAAKGATRKDGRKINWDEEWRDSEENKKVLQEIDHLKSERKKVNQPDPITLHEFASPAWLQTTELTKRMFTQYWRDPAYLYGKLFTAVIVGIVSSLEYRINMNLTIIPVQRLHFLETRKFHSGHAKSNVHLILNYSHPAHRCQRSLAQIFLESCSVDGERKALEDLRLGGILHRKHSQRDSHCYFQWDNLLGSVVLGNWSASRFFNFWLCIPHDSAVLPFPGQLGTVDLCLCSILYCHF